MYGQFLVSDMHRFCIIFKGIVSVQKYGNAAPAYKGEHGAINFRE